MEVTVEDAEHAIASFDKINSKLRGKIIDVEEVKEEARTAARHSLGAADASSHAANSTLKYRLAAFAIDDALSGRGDYGRLHMHDKSRHMQRAFHAERSELYQAVYTMVVMLHTAIAYFEENYHTAGVAVSAVCLSLYLADIAVLLTYLRLQGLQAQRRHWVTIAIFILLFVDFVLFCDNAWIQPFRLLRPWMLVPKDRELRQVFLAIVSTWRVILRSVAIIFVFVMFFAAIGTRLFQEDYTSTSNSHQGGLFDDIGPALVHLFILVTVQNYPSVMMDAYKAHERNFGFFLIFLVGSIFFLTPMTLAVVMV